MLALQLIGLALIARLPKPVARPSDAPFAAG
jgi:hypothetical protein